MTSHPSPITRADDVMTVVQAARRLGMTTEGVKAAIRRGKLAAERRPSEFYANGVYYLRPVDVEAYAVDKAAHPNRGGRPVGPVKKRRGSAVNGGQAQTRAGSH